MVSHLSSFHFWCFKLLFAFGGDRDVQPGLHHAHRVPNVKASISQHDISRLKIVQNTRIFCKIFITYSTAPGFWHEGYYSLWCYAKKFFRSIVMFVRRLGTSSTFQVWRALNKYFKAINDYYNFLSKWSPVTSRCKQPQSFTVRPFDEWL